MTEFNELGLAAPILAALTEKGYSTPTPIQAQAIPVTLEGKDLLGIAQTGTGKTAAFALPILQLLTQNRQPAPRFGARVLVLAPTRELAGQIAESFRTYGRHTKLSVATVFGGVPHGPQIKALARGIDILVATPGRLVDHLDARTASLGGVEFLVLDEVDRMLDLGFIKPIHRIVRLLPKQRHNLFFSATMPAEIASLANELLTSPVTVRVAPAASTVERVSQQVMLVDTSAKTATLVGLFGDPAVSRTIVFTRTKHGANKVERHLMDAGIAASAIHGNKSQGQRERALAQFRAGKVRALVATDIAARGIDVDGVTHVVNFDLPEVAETYVHRIGRTARAGAEGIAISLVSNGEMNLMRAIERLTRTKVPMLDQRSPGQANSHADVEGSAAAPRDYAGDPARRRRPHAPGNENQAAPGNWARRRQNRNGAPQRSGHQSSAGATRASAPRQAAR